MPRLTYTGIMKTLQLLSLSLTLSACVEMPASTTTDEAPSQAARTTQPEAPEAPVSRPDGVYYGSELSVRPTEFCTPAQIITDGETFDIEYSLATATRTFRGKPEMWITIHYSNSHNHPILDTQDYRNQFLRAAKALFVDAYRFREGIDVELSIKDNSYGLYVAILMVDEYAGRGKPITVTGPCTTHTVLDLTK
jgi:hypothetical protein